MREVASLIDGFRRLTAEGARRAPRVPIGAQVVAVANAYDELVASETGPRVGRTEAMDALRSGPTRFKNEVLEALASAVEARGDAGRRRRRGDAEAEERGAA
jgi:hypothetical protein